MVLFRVHFEGGTPLDIEAETPAAATAVAKMRRPGELITKIKKVRGNG